LGFTRYQGFDPSPYHYHYHHYGHHGFSKKSETLRIKALARRAAPSVSGTLCRGDFSIFWSSWPGVVKIWVFFMVFLWCFYGVFMVILWDLVGLNGDFMVFLW